MQKACEKRITINDAQYFKVYLAEQNVNIALLECSAIGLNRKLKAIENESKIKTSIPLLRLVPRSWTFGDFEEHHSG